MKDEFEIDPSEFYVFSRDLLRVDVGLIITRPPIFLTMRKRDVEFLKYKNDIMNEYHLDQRQYVAEIEEVAKLNEDPLADNPYRSRKNIDNYPTHRYTDPNTGDTQEYCAASKYFKLVDPAMSDRRSIHYAGEDKVYLILRNKFTKEWEFPTSQIKFGQTFLRVK